MSSWSCSGFYLQIDFEMMVRLFLLTSSKQQNFEIKYETNSCKIALDVIDSGNALVKTERSCRSPQKFVEIYTKNN